jgi:hypothetical protein
VFFWWQHCPSGHNAHTGSALVVEFFCFTVTGGTPPVKKKKPSLSLLLGCEFLLLGVMAGVVYGGQQSCSKPRKKIQSFDDSVVGTMICGHHLSLLLLFLERPASSVFFGKFQRNSGKSPAKVRRLPVTVSVLFFSVFLLF